MEDSQKQASEAFFRVLQHPSADGHRRLRSSGSREQLQPELVEAHRVDRHVPHHATEVGGAGRGPRAELSPVHDATAPCHLNCFEVTASSNMRLNPKLFHKA